MLKKPNTKLNLKPDTNISLIKILIESLPLARHSVCAKLWDPAMYKTDLEFILQHERGKVNRIIMLTVKVVR